MSLVEEEVKEKTVVQYLKEVVYDFAEAYEPSLFAYDFLNFVKMVNGGEDENKSPVVHMKMLDKVPMDGDTINMCHRGIAKSTLLGEYLFLYLAVMGKIPGFGKVNLAIYVSDSMENGVKNMRKNLEFRWENSEFLQQYLPKAKFTESRWEFTNIDGQVFIVKGYGAKTGVRGARELGVRPQLAVLDDLISDKDSSSATVIADIEKTISSAIEYALHPTHRKIIWSGTPFNARDPLYKAVESGAWHVNVYPVCEKFPCTREEFRGSWPDRFTYDYVNRMYLKAKKQGQLHMFNQELMLKIMSEEDQIVKDHHIQWYSRKVLLSNKGAYNFYMTTDFATSEEAKSDFSVISVWAVDSKSNWFWVDGVCAKQLMSQNITDLFRLVGLYRPLEVGIEVSGQQGGFISIIKKEMMDTNNFFTLATDNNGGKEGIRPTTQKSKRFDLVQPWFHNNLMHFPVEMRESNILLEAMDEISLITFGGFKSAHDDFIDTITMLPSLNVWRPSVDSEMRYNSGNDTWEADESEEEFSSLQSYIC
jgi:phage terminase large subunit-like protein